MKSIVEVNEFLKNSTKKQIIEQLLIFDKAYHADASPLISDDYYDKIKDFLFQKDPKNSYFKRVGADEDNATPLPYWMGSLDKIKDDDKAFSRWTSKFPGSVVIADKLDGISAMIVKSPESFKIYTRGNGSVGSDITHLAEFIPSLLALKNKAMDYKIALRGELIISKKNFEKCKSINSELMNGRNTAAGIVNSKINNKSLLKYLDFVCYDLLEPNKQTLSESLEIVKSALGIKTVFWYSCNDKLELKSLYSSLLERKKGSEYDIDGLVITSNTKPYSIIPGKNPKHSIAFKSSQTSETAEVEIQEIEWNISKDKYLKPILIFKKAVVLAGVSIQKATGFNAGYIQKNKIGPGSVVEIIRAGDVIPHVHSVVSESPQGPQLPNQSIIPYEWTTTGVDIFATSENRESIIKRNVHFMKTLKVKHISDSTIAKLYDNGIKTIPNLLDVKFEALMKIDGIQEKTAQMIVNSMKSVIEKNTIQDLMHASNIFGRGIGKLKIAAIMNKYPDILLTAKNKLPTPEEIHSNVESIGVITATQFLGGISEFKNEFQNYLKNIHTVPTVVADTQQSPNKNIVGKVIVFTGVRNKELEDKIALNGGRVSNTINKNTSMLVTPSKTTKETTKIKSAIELGIPIVTIDEFEKLFI
jgi:DNA ligase (NAD+)